MKILITGASGFIGQSLQTQLAEKSISYKAAFRKLLEVSNKHAIAVGSIDGSTDWSVALQEVDVVVHLAARAHVMKDEVSDPIAEYRKVNTDGTLNLARQSVSAGVKRFIFFSSIGVNGNNSVKPFTFSDTHNPHDSYSRSKYDAELGLKKISKETGLELVVIRPPLVYGKGAPGNFASLLKLVTKNLPLPLGAIHNKRSFISIDNLVDFITICIDHPNAVGQTFLVSDDEDVSTTELLRSLTIASGNTSRLIPVNVTFLRFFASMLGKSSNIDKLAGDLQIDMNHVKDTLQWNPPLTFKEGVSRCFSDD